ncbi:MAG: hypothetical protein ABH865_08015 [Candidatus Omnitrophota bacterium]
MSWVCPHQAAGNVCRMRKKICKPLAAGCVLVGKYTFLEAPAKKTKKNRCPDKSRS